MSRIYKQTRRARAHAETRQKIVGAAVALHQEKGPQQTSFGEIADLAGVGRVTVYRHFPDSEAMMRACSAHYFGRHPLPDPAPLDAIEDPSERLRAALRLAFGYHATTRSMMAHILPGLRKHPVMAPYRTCWSDVADRVAAAWPEAAQPALGAALALALDFCTWRMLAEDQGLSDADAIGILAGLFPVPR